MKLRILTFVSILAIGGPVPAYSTVATMKVDKGSQAIKVINIQPNNTRKLNRIYKHAVLKFSDFVIPSSAKTETGDGVYEFYEVVWEQLLTENQPLMLLIKNGLLITKSSLWTFATHYIYGDFNGLCIRQRVAQLFKRDI